MQEKTLLEGLARVAGLALFFAGLYFVSQAYTMALHGIYIDCFLPEAQGCALQPYQNPTFTSWLYGTALAVIALGTFYLGTRAMRWVKK